MKRLFPIIFLLPFCAFFVSCNPSDRNPYWNEGTPIFEVQEIFSNERFPNVIVTKDGTVIATWGNKNIRVRRSEDSGETWGPEIAITDSGFHGGDTLLDESTGDIMLFVEESHPPVPLTIYRSVILHWQQDVKALHRKV